LRLQKAWELMKALLPRQLHEHPTVGRPGWQGGPCPTAGGAPGFGERGVEGDAAGMQLMGS